MLDDFPICVQPKDVDPGPILVFIGGPFLMAVQYNIVPFGNHSFKRNTLTWVLLSHTFEIGNERLFSVSNMGIMLYVLRTDVPLYCLARPVLVEHEVVEGLYRLFVLLQLIQ